MSDSAQAPRTWTPEELRAEVATRNWFHTIDLGNGVVTPGYEDTAAKFPHMGLPDDLTGKTVIDIGAYDGVFSFEAERRGAARVLATDGVAWTWPGGDARRNFELACEVLGSSVESQTITVEELSPEAVGGTFDVVLFYGVLYHSPDPLGYLKRVRSVTGGMAIIETAVDLLDVEVPALAYYPDASFNNDGSNWFGPNIAALDGLLRDAGFGTVEIAEPWSTNLQYALAPIVVDDSAPPVARSGRVVAIARP